MAQLIDLMLFRESFKNVNVFVMIHTSAAVVNCARNVLLLVGFLRHLNAFCSVKAQRGKASDSTSFLIDSLIRIQFSDFLAVSYTSLMDIDFYCNLTCLYS